MKTEFEYAENCASVLEKEGVAHYFETSEAGQSKLRIPSWEMEDGDLSSRAIYEFIHTKLAGQSGKGFALRAPIGDAVQIYTYDPFPAEEGLALTTDHILIWGYGPSIDAFEWGDVEYGDDRVWEDGPDPAWEMRHLTQRIGFLSCMLNYEIIDLPPVPPLTRQELIDDLEAGCEPFHFTTKKPNERLLGSLNEEGQLVLNKKSDNSDTILTDEHFDSLGRLVFEDEVVMHRTWPC
jgi:hypothetical protein